MPHQIRPGFDLDLLGGQALLDLDAILASIDAPPNIDYRYRLSRELISGIDRLKAEIDEARAYWASRNGKKGGRGYDN